MFSLCAKSPELAESDLYRLCASLNAPSVNLDGLPAGPTRAVIVLHIVLAEGGTRVPELSIGFRSIGSGSVAVYRYSGDIRELSSASRAMETALSFAEAMGFLFDEDLVGDREGPGKAAALALWQKLVGPGELDWDPLTGLDGVLDAGELDLQFGDAELDGPDTAVREAVLAAPALEAGQAADDDVAAFGTAPASEFSEALAETGRVELRDPAAGTRFTDDENAAGGPVAAAGASKLGRVPIVQMRVKADGTVAVDEKLDRTLRLLSSF